jgi:sensor c-di-GMP phosphodiesterase-like protein
MIDLNDITEGFSNNEFYLEYLPTIRFSDNCCVGAEALMRWRRPSGVVMPGEFIPLIENSPLSGTVTYWVIERIAQELGDWLRQHDDVHLSFNVPPEILGRGGLDLAGEKTGLKEVQEKLIVEITERSVPDKLGIDALNLFWERQKRSKTALDDIGLGRGNLVVLARVAADYIKLDRSIVEQIQPDGPNPNLLTQLNGLVERGDAQVIAEGIETAYQLEQLRGIGVTLGQGWLFSKPLGAEQFREFFSSRNS